MRSLLNVHKPVGGFKFKYHSTKFPLVFRLMEVLPILLSKFIIYLYCIGKKSQKLYFVTSTRFFIYFILTDYFSKINSILYLFDQNYYDQYIIIFSYILNSACQFQYNNV